MPLRDSIRFELELGLLISFTGLKKFLLEEFAPYSDAFAAGLFVIPSKYGCARHYYAVSLF
jgi:hypothetical protein